MWTSNFDEYMYIEVEYISEYITYDVRIFYNTYLYLSNVYTNYLLFRNYNFIKLSRKFSKTCKVLANKTLCINDRFIIIVVCK